MVIEMLKASVRGDVLGILFFNFGKRYGVYTTTWELVESVYKNIPGSGGES